MAVSEPLPKRISVWRGADGELYCSEVYRGVERPRYVPEAALADTQAALHQCRDLLRFNVEAVGSLKEKLADAERRVTEARAEGVRAALAGVRERAARANNAALVLLEGSPARSLFLAEAKALSLAADGVAADLLPAPPPGAGDEGAP